MFRQEMFNFLQATIIFLLLTNAVSALAAMYAIWVANGSAPGQELTGALARKARAVINRAG